MVIALLPAWLIGSAITGVLAIGPCLLATSLAARWRIHSIFWYPGWALATAAIVATVSAWLSSGPDWDGETLSFGEALARHAAVLMPAGFAGGVAFRWADAGDD